MSTPSTHTAAVRQVIRALKAKGWHLTAADNGVDARETVHTEAEALAVIDATGDAWVYFTGPGRVVKGFWALTCNLPEETIADWHCADERFDDIIGEVTAAWL